MVVVVVDGGVVVEGADATVVVGWEVEVLSVVAG